ncbi:hypothetical protein SFBSU_007G34 [Candidatus Arthromitus sp. SFB-mouse-SU]|uniref:hypothetical protein n=1 Tax=Candidatus Arthromitus sp. SFB-mouse TaxID=49118 RepID=UPI00022AE818|nr:hypothetical protein [Candidatus Arthromitus sp. SFB-mouse]EIA22308.1 hypothetical protein SFB2_260G15 [Candidatus Arthromitus sp. SFB-2]EIA23451.1 hypothetical protein SFB1_162G0 [Candidatus Arthromitus sp. SFB-1]EIA27219.1 hypothetical protein SFB6_116G15 [Candidatus Arthromitus sp. SFB-co]EIA29895.1 hypothetical protein SFBSU_007G34 [Candidatus Arthromitus sp. SFB-mouse-SU]EGX28445.1 hypothetical protein SFBNYU_004620 [Candidatus Arthromitus sp. SFB-mouse-NYU]
MLIFLCFGLIVCFFVIERIACVKNKNRFDNLMNKSDFGDDVTKSDLVSFRHEMGETIFEIQKEIEQIKTSLESLRKQNNSS